jgi:hypothetical protein
MPNRDPDYGFGLLDAGQAACELAMPPAIPGVP